MKSQWRQSAKADGYNSRRPHSSLDGKTPDQVYFNTLPQIKAA